MTIALALLMLAAAPETAAEKSVKQISVEGRSFNVEMNGDRAFVTPVYAILRGYSMDGHAVKLGRRAAEMASGCRTASGRSTPGGLIVKLDCDAPR